MEPKDREKQVFIANLMPARGSWLGARDRQEGPRYARIDRKRKLPVTVLLRAMEGQLHKVDGSRPAELLKLDHKLGAKSFCRGHPRQLGGPRARCLRRFGELGHLEELAPVLAGRFRRPLTVLDDDQLRYRFDESRYMDETIISTPSRRWKTTARTPCGFHAWQTAIVELFKKQRPGEPPSVEAGVALLEQLFDPKRYDLTRVGRYKLNARLDLDIDLDTRVLTKDDMVALIKEPDWSAAPARDPGGSRRGEP